VPRCGSNYAHQGESSDTPIFFFNFLKKNLGLNDVKIGPERHVKKGGPERRGPE
jgi:hypothetical protein